MLLVIVSTTIYLYFLHLFQQTKASKAFFWKLVGITAVILVFSYNAFSYDLFNYIFDAKIVTHYHQNPYIHQALDFPGDPMLGFMHWTNRTYPYGPIWLGITVPLSFIGANYFVITFFLFKILIVGSYAGTVYFLYKIGEKLKFENPLYQTAFFAFNPLVIIEFCISAHNDIVMIFFAIWAIYYMLEKKYVWAFVLLFLSIGLKYATVFFLPVFIFLLWKRNINNIAWYKLFLEILLLMLIPLFYVTMRTNFQPWYLIYILALVPLIPQYKIVQKIILFVSVVSLGVYIPFLFFGNWNSSFYTVQTAIYYWLSLAGMIAGLGFLTKALFAYL